MEDGARNDAPHSTKPEAASQAPAARDKTGTSRKLSARPVGFAQVPLMQVSLRKNLGASPRDLYTSAIYTSEPRLSAHLRRASRTREAKRKGDGLGTTPESFNPLSRVGDCAGGRHPPGLRSIPAIDSRGGGNLKSAKRQRAPLPARAVYLTSVLRVFARVLHRLQILLRCRRRAVAPNPSDSCNTLTRVSNLFISFSHFYYLRS